MEPDVTEQNQPLPSALAGGPGTTEHLLSFIDASPSPYHVCVTVKSLLAGAGFVERVETAPWTNEAGRFYVQRGGTIVAWIEPGRDAAAPFAIVGAHTDSPNLRIKPQPDTGSTDFRQVGVEIYGGVLLNSWLDRDLGVSGRVALRSGESLLRIDRPILRIPQLAIHLDREISDRGLNLNRQQHMRPIWGLRDTSPGGFKDLIAGELDIDADDIMAWDLMTHDLTPSAIVGADESLIAAPRLDNQLSCWASVAALVEATEADAGSRPMVCLFDHEEVGSQSAAGAGSAILPSLIERIISSAGGNREDYHVALANSFCVSADGAHATHPNYVERHDPDHQISLNGGPVVKINANERYATTASSHSRFIQACEAAGSPYQRFVSRSDMPCGSTIGPITSARLGITTVDAGVAQLAMHSARETAGSFDPPRFARVLTQLLS